MKSIFCLFTGAYIMGKDSNHWILEYIYYYIKSLYELSKTTRYQKISQTQINEDVIN